MKPAGASSPPKLRETSKVNEAAMRRYGAKISKIIKAQGPPEKMMDNVIGVLREALGPLATPEEKVDLEIKYKEIKDTFVKKKKEWAEKRRREQEAYERKRDHTSMLRLGVDEFGIPRYQADCLSSSVYLNGWIIELINQLKRIPERYPETCEHYKSEMKYWLTHSFQNIYSESTRKLFEKYFYLSRFDDDRTIAVLKIDDIRRDNFNIDDAFMNLVRPYIPKFMIEWCKANHRYCELKEDSDGIKRLTYPYIPNLDSCTYILSYVERDLKEGSEEIFSEKNTNPYVAELYRFIKSINDSNYPNIFKYHRDEMNEWLKHYDFNFIYQSDLEFAKDRNERFLANDILSGNVNIKWPQFIEERYPHLIIHIRINDIKTILDDYEYELSEERPRYVSWKHDLGKLPKTIFDKYFFSLLRIEQSYPTIYMMHEYEIAQWIRSIRRILNAYSAARWSVLNEEELFNALYDDFPNCIKRCCEYNEWFCRYDYDRKYGYVFKGLTIETCDDIKTVLDRMENQYKDIMKTGKIPEKKDSFKPSSKHSFKFKIGAGITHGEAGWGCSVSHVNKQTSWRQNINYSSHCGVHAHAEYGHMTKPITKGFKW